MTISHYDLRRQLLAWVQNHTTYRGRRDDGLGVLVSDNEAVEELLDCMLPRLDRLADYRLADLSPRERTAVEVVAYELSSKCGAYNGSPSDAVTDAIGIVRAAGIVLP